MIDQEVEPLPGGRVVGVSKDGSLRVVGVELTGPADYARVMHKLGPVAAKLCAEAMVANALMGASVKGEERISLQLQGERPRFAFMGDVNADGGLRARFTPNMVHASALEGIDGVFLAIKSVVGRELYRGASEVQSESIAAALQRYVDESAQQDAVILLQTDVEPDGRVLTAAGVLLERLPASGDEDRVVARERFLGRWSAMTERPAIEVLAAVEDQGEIDGLAVEVLERASLPWRCQCSRVKVESMLAGLGVPTMRQMRDEDGRAEVTCHFCQRVVVLSVADLDRLIEMVEGWVVEA